MPSFARLARILILCAVSCAVSSKATDICKSAPGGMTCTIRRVGDCLAIPPPFLGPYVLSNCQNTYKAVVSMVDIFRKRTGRSTKQVAGSMTFYVNTVDGVNQTIAPCMRTGAPWDAREVISPGIAICDLAAYTMSLSREDSLNLSEDGNPVGMTKLYPGFFSELLMPTGKDSASAYDTVRMNQLTKSLGAYGVMQFFADHPAYVGVPIDDLPLYLPDDLAGNPEYHGISAGGGDGWGGEIVTDGDILLSFGGGGGAGMTSNTSSTYIGGGGGGGVQNTRDAINGLGIGAGTSYRAGAVQYTFNSYCGGPSPSDEDDIASQYSSELEVTFQFLKGVSFQLNGGGGIGSGYEYLKESGVEYPQSMSTGTGFSFSYEFATGTAAREAPQYPLSRAVEDLYQQLGIIQGKCARSAPLQCPTGYDDYACVCQAQYNCTLTEAKKIVKTPSEIPSWVLYNYCPGAQDLGPGSPSPALPNPCQGGAVLG